jgi:hypothetical protein
MTGLLCGGGSGRVFFVGGEEVVAFVDELANGCGGDVVSAFAGCGQAVAYALACLVPILLQKSPMS